MNTTKYTQNLSYFKKTVFGATMATVFVAIFVFISLIFTGSTLSASATEMLVDDVPLGSIANWQVTDTGGNPIFTYEEILSPYDGSTAIRTSVVGTTTSMCPSQSISKTYAISGNTSNTKLEAYLAFTSTMETYTFPYVVVELYDEHDERVGYQIYYGDGVIGSLYASYANDDPASYTELPADSGDMILDLSRIGTDIDFSSLKITLANYACVGQNSVTFDHLRVINGSFGEDILNTVPEAAPDSFTVSAGESHSGQVSGTDVDDDSLTFELLVAPVHGTLLFYADGNFTYTADLDYAGEDSFIFRANDGQADSAPATVSITVTTPEPTKVIRLLIYNPNVRGPNNEECKGQYGAIPYDYLEANNVEITYWCNNSVIDAGVLANYDVLYVGRARADYYEATYIDSTDLKNWVSDGGGAILESTGDSFEPGTTNIIWPGIHDLFGYNHCPAIGDSDNAGGGPLNKYADHPIWNGVSGPIGDSSTGLYDSELIDSCIGTGIKIGTSGASAQNPMVNEFGSGRTYSGVLVDYTINADSQKYFLNIVDWVAQGGSVPNTPPVAHSKSFSVAQGSSYSGAVSGTDADGDSLTFEHLVAPMYGSRCFNSDGSFTYTADSDYSGEDSFTFRAYDGRDYSAPATVSISVTKNEEAAPSRRRNTMIFPGLGQQIPNAITEGEVLGASTSEITTLKLKVTQLKLIVSLLQMVQHLQNENMLK